MKNGKERIKSLTDWKYPLEIWEPEGKINTTLENGGECLGYCLGCRWRVVFEDQFSSILGSDGLNRNHRRSTVPDALRSLGGSGTNGKGQYQKYGPRIGVARTKWINIIQQKLTIMENCRNCILICNHETSSLGICSWNRRNWNRGFECPPIPQAFG